MEKAAATRSASRARSIALCGLSIAFMAVGAWVTVPLGPIPFTLSTLAIMFALFALEPKQALASIAGYLILGAIGLPVFSSFKGGVAALMGPTGGFLVGFIVAGAVALGIGALAQKTALFSSETKKSFFGVNIAAGTLARNILVGVVFLAVLYVFGWAWLMYMGNLSPEAAFVAAVAPFIPIDLAKMVVAVLLAQAVGAAVRASGIQR